MNLFTVEDSAPAVFVNRIVSQKQPKAEYDVSTNKGQTYGLMCATAHGAVSSCDEMCATAHRKTTHRDFRHGPPP